MQKIRIIVAALIAATTISATAGNPPGSHNDYVLFKGASEQNTAFYLDLRAYYQHAIQDVTVVNGDAQIDETEQQIIKGVYANSGTWWHRFQDDKGAAWFQAYQWRYQTETYQTTPIWTLPAAKQVWQDNNLISSQNVNSWAYIPTPDAPLYRLGTRAQSAGNWSNSETYYSAPRVIRTAPDWSGVHTEIYATFTYTDAFGTHAIDPTKVTKLGHFNRIGVTGEYGIFSDEGTESWASIPDTNYWSGQTGNLWGIQLQGITYSGFDPQNRWVNVDVLGIAINGD